MISSGFSFIFRLFGLKVPVFDPAAGVFTFFSLTSLTYIIIADHRFLEKLHSSGCKAQRTGTCSCKLDDFLTRPVDLCDFLSIIDIEMCEFFAAHNIEMCLSLRIDLFEKCGGALC